MSKKRVNRHTISWQHNARLHQRHTQMAIELANNAGVFMRTTRDNEEDAVPDTETWRLGIAYDALVGALMHLQPLVDREKIESAHGGASSIELAQEIFDLLEPHPKPYHIPESPSRPGRWYHKKYYKT